MSPSATKRSRQLRQKKPVVYDVSDDEEDELVEVSQHRTSGRTRAQPSRLAEYVDIDEALSGRPKKSVKVLRKKRKGKTQGKKTSQNETEEESADELTLRNAERRTLEATKLRRDQFYIHYRELFERLLPQRNYISRMVEKREEERDDDFAVVEEDVVPYKLLDAQPEHVQATMKPYQIAGLSYLVWLYKNGVSGILGDEMGLGKTLQTLSLFSYLTTYEPVTKGHKRPFLVVCPLSVVSSWVSECARWTPHLQCLRFHGPTSERAHIKKNAEGYDVVVTSYEIFEKEKSWFRKAFVWRYVVLDEGHKIKNEKSLIAQSLQGLKAEFRLILTGTPLQNNMQELWALLHWLYPDVFTDNTNRKFEDAFNLTLGKNDIGFMDDARLLLELIMLRRMKNSKGVDLNLPPKTELLLYLPLSPMQRFWYKRLLTRVDKGLLEELFSDSKTKVAADLSSVGAVATELASLDDTQWAAAKKAIAQTATGAGKTGAQWMKLMNLVMQLRKCCNHPYLLPGAEPVEGSMDYASASAALMLASSKLIFLDKLVETLCIAEGRKVLIFSGFTKMLDVVEDFLYTKGGNGIGSEKPRFKFGRLDGSTVRARRNLAIRLFNQDPEYKIMLISTRAGGLGINLASASDVVMLDTDWNPQADLQAQARAHRIGQKNPVTVYRLITQGTVEEQMMGRIRKKLYLSAKVTEGMRDLYTNEDTNKDVKKEDTAGDMPSMSTGQLLALVRSGSRAIAREGIDVAEMLNWDWNTLLKKCTDYGDEVKKEEEGVLEDSTEEEKKWLSEMEKVEARVFEGKKHEKGGPKANRLIAEEWLVESKRVGVNRVVMIGGHAVLKETVGNNEWEAVATIAGKDPRVTEPKRERKKINHQDYCQICYDGGDLYVCSRCPRVYHMQCLSPHFKAQAKHAMQFICSQHECYSCSQKTQNCGGLIFRCRWCERGYCEDCLNWDETELIGNSIPELEVLEYGAMEQVYWIKCEGCVELHEHDPTTRELCESMERDYDLAKNKLLEAEAEEEEKLAAQLKQTEVEKTAKELKPDPTKAGDAALEKEKSDELAVVLKTELAVPLSAMLTDASTVESSAVSTPVSEQSDWFSKGKRKMEDRHSASARKGKKAKKHVDATLRFKDANDEAIWLD